MRIDRVHVGPVEGPSKFSWVSPSYFQTLNIPLLAGRNFTERDTGASQRVAIVNQTFLSKYLGGANPLGRTLRTDAEPSYPSTVYEIVGVIADTKYNNLRGVTPAMAFAPAPQDPFPAQWTALMIDSDQPPSTIIEEVQRRLSENHPEMITEFRVFETQIHDGMIRERLMALLSGGFGALAALLAMVGLYGVLSYTVARRRNEIGIRVALGARRDQVLGMVMREASGLLAIGIAVGLGLSLILGRGASSLLFGLRSYDPLSLSAAAGLLTLIGGVASFLPARRASVLDPMTALRYD
jgi:predicted permease